MTIKNIPLLYLTLVVLSTTHCGCSLPFPENGLVRPAFEPPREMLLLVNDNAAATPGLESSSAPPTGTGPAVALTPTQAIAEELANTNAAPPSAPAATQASQSAPITAAFLEAAAPVATQSPPTQNTPSTSPEAPAGNDNAALISFDVAPSKDLSENDDGPAPATLVVNPAPINTPPGQVPDADGTPVQGDTAPVTTPVPRTTLSVPPQFYSYSTNTLAMYTSYRGLATTSPSAPLSSKEPTTDESETAKQSHRAAVVGSLVAVGLLMALAGFIFCFRCRCLRRKKKTSPLDLLVEESEKQSLSAEEKGKSSPFSSPTIEGVTLPVLRSHAPHTVTFEDSPDQQEWRLVSTNHEGIVEESTHVITGDSFMDIDLNSHSDMLIVGMSEGVAGSNARTSAGAASTGAHSYSTRASTYSHPSIEQRTRISASMDKLNQLASLATTSAPRSRKRSKTETSAAPPSFALFKSTISLPSITSYQNRFSGDSTKTRKTSCSVDSEWDIAQDYGARYSKESGAGSSILSTISEATMESAEAVEVGGKQCVLMKGKA